MAGNVGTLTPHGPHVGAPLLLGEPGLSVRIIVRACPSPARSQRWMQRCPPRGFWGLPIEARLIYEASGASRVVLRHGGVYLVPFLYEGKLRLSIARSSGLLNCALQQPAPAANKRSKGSRTSPHRAAAAPMRPTAPPPPAPAAPSPLGGPASSARCPPTLRSPPRPRGAANRAGERVTPLFLLEPPGPVAQRT